MVSVRLGMIERTRLTTRRNDCVGHVGFGIYLETT